MTPQRLIAVGAATGTAAATGSVAETTLGVIHIILLVLPWAGAVLLLGMIVHGPLRWALTRWAPARAWAGR